MFNLIVVNGCNFKKNRSFDFDCCRIFEYTDNDIRQRYQKSDNTIDFEKLYDLPCLFMQEGNKSKMLAYIGKIDGCKKYHSGFLEKVEILYSLYPECSCPISNDIIFSYRHELDIDDFEFSRNHWAVKNFDLLRFYIRYNKKRSFSPKVFKLEEFPKVEENLIAVMMPFDKGFDEVYKSIETLNRTNKLTLKRADNFWLNTFVIDDIIQLIDTAYIVICDLTNKNPNVFYEMGIAHVLGKHTIIITQNEGDIPFDVGHHRYIHYHDNKEGRLILQKSLEERIKSIITCED